MAQNVANFVRGRINFATKSIWKRIYSCDGLCRKHKFCHIFEPFSILYFLFDHMKNFNLITWKKKQILPHFTPNGFFKIRKILNGKNFTYFAANFCPEFRENPNYNRIRCCWWQLNVDLIQTNIFNKRMIENLVSKNAKSSNCNYILFGFKQ